MMAADDLGEHRSDSLREQLLVDAILPAVGFSLPTDRRQDVVPLTDSELLHLRFESQSQLVQPSLLFVEKPKIPAISELPPCQPISVEFDSISVDVKCVVPWGEEAGKSDPWCLLKCRSALNVVRSGFGCGESGQKTTKRVLHEASGTLKSRKLVALMGASGAGKSTLLNVLSGRIDQTSGTVKLNGQPVTRSNVQNCSAYVQQLDLFLANLTAEEHLQAQLELRLPASTRKQARQERATILFNEMSLAKCRNTIIGSPGGLGGGLSGGERKRLNVASELARLPGILFADEPTTGLDSFIAKSVMLTLRRLADSGRTVIVTIHQPSSKLFEMFDEVVLLAEGLVIYAGDRLGCLAWIERFGFRCPPYSNPADFIIKVVSVPETGDLREKKMEQLTEWAATWAREGEAFKKRWEKEEQRKFLENIESLTESQLASSYAPVSHAQPGSSQDKESDGVLQVLEKDVSLNTVAKNAISQSFDAIEVQQCSGQPEDLLLKSQGPGWFRQVGILCRRAANENKRNRMLVHARAIQTVVLGFVIGVLFFRLGWSMSDSQARLGGLYTILLNQSMAGAFAVTNTFVLEKPIIRREYESGLLYPSAHMLGKMLADFAVQIVFPVIFVTITYWLIGLNDSFARFAAVLLIVLLVSNAAMSVGYFASAVASSPDTAAVTCNLTVLPLTIFGGFMVKLEDSPKWLRWIQEISFVKYGFFGAAVTIFRDESLVRPDGQKIDGLEFLYYQLGVTERTLLYTLGFLLLLLVVYRIIAGVAYTVTMRFKKESKS